MMVTTISHDLAPAELLGRIQTRFRELGLFGSPLTLTHNGEKYLAACDDHAFAVYRLVNQGHVPPGLPAARAGPSAWSPPRPWWMKPARPTCADDEFASGLSLEEWLEYIESLYYPTKSIR